MRAPRTELLVEVDAELDSPERIARVPLVNSATGRVMRVSDISDIRKHQIDPPATIALHGDRRVVLVNAKMQPGLQIGRWVDNALATLAEFRATLPNGISARIVYNQNTYTAARMAELGKNLLFALVIVMVVLIWFMGARSALTVGVALPLSGAMVLIGMSFLNVPLHQMSVTGLIISLGLLIDNAIVVVEDYRLRRSRGSDIADAITRSCLLYTSPSPRDS